MKVEQHHQKYLRRSGEKLVQGHYLREHDQGRSKFAVYVKIELMFDMPLSMLVCALCIRKVPDEKYTVVVRSLSLTITNGCFD